jgi:general secretion pathway protein A
MYESFYGLREKPFNLLPDPEYLYMSQGHENAYAHLEYAITENKGFVIITGEIGSGKTTLINFLLNKIPLDIQVGLINNTSMPPVQFMKMICEEFELDAEGLDKARMIGIFHDYLLTQFAQKKRVTLIIDEAQNLPSKTMEEIRMLSNLEAEKHHLVQIILVGQPELKYKLRRRNLEQFAQRVAVYCHLEALKRDEVEDYILHRLRMAGSGERTIFDKDAVEAVSTHSRGIPRLINVLCDSALVYGYADGLETIDAGVVREVVKGRGEAGISCVAFDEGESRGEPPYPTTGERAEGDLAYRVESIERRLQLLENLVSKLDQKVDLLEHRRGERDEVVLDLLRMLKESMDRRYEMLFKVERLSRGHGGSASRAATEEDPAVSPSGLTSFRKAKNDKL